MSTIASSKGGDYKIVPQGNHPARCYQILDLGTQNGMYLNKPKISHKVQLAWELADEMIEIDGKVKPMSIRKKYTLSLNKKAALRKDLESWRGKAFTEEEAKSFDVAKLLDAPCLLNVIHEQGEDGMYAIISTIAKLPKGMPEPPALVNPKVHYEIEMGRNEVFNSLSDYMKELIGKCREWNTPTGQQADNTDPASFPPSEEDAIQPEETSDVAF